MTPPRAAQFVNTLDIGGATEYAMRLAQSADPFGTGTVLIAGPGDEWADKAADEGLDIERLETFVPTHPTFNGPMPSTRAQRLSADGQALRDLTQILRRRNIRLLHSHGSKSRLFGALAGRAARVDAIVQTAHGFSFHDTMAAGPRAARKTAEQLTGLLGHHLILESRFDRDRAAEFRLAPKNALSYIYTGIDFETAAASRSPEAVRRDLGVPVDAVMFVTVGRLSDQKDPVTLAKAAVKLLAQRPEAHIVFVGDGTLRADVERVIAGHEDCVHLLGMRSDVPDLLGAADVLVMTSRWEGVPLSILMAMLAEKPVVASHITGIPEVVLDNKTGLGISPGDVAGFAGAMQRLYDNPDLRAQFGLAGAELVRRRHSLDAMAEAHLQLYSSLLT